MSAQREVKARRLVYKDVDHLIQLEVKQKTLIKVKKLKFDDFH